MKKFLWLIVCLMTMVLSANAQSWKDAKYHKIKEVAVKEFKSNLIAPSQFILSDSNGEKITIDDLYVSLKEEETKDGKFYPKCWVVLVTGDAMNRMGGYKHTSGIVYIYGTEDYPYANYPYYTRKCEDKNKD